MAMKKDARIYVAGHKGLAGSAIMRRLQQSGYRNLLTRTHAELELIDGGAVREFVGRERPEYIFLAAARVGGVLANATYPAEFLVENLAIELNVIREAFASGVERLLFLGSSCIYPRECPQPIREEYLLTGPLEETNRAYALAKIAGIELCGAHNRQYGTRYLAAMPTNLYGPGDNYDSESSHVLAALVWKMVEARRNGAGEVSVWGSGSPRREFLHSDDMASACVSLMNLPESDFVNLCDAGTTAPLVNIGCGEDLTIAELAEQIRELSGYQGRLVFDRSRPDGTPRKLLNISILREHGWHPKITLRDGLRQVIAEYESRVGLSR